MKSERSKRHSNMLASVAVCGGLMVAYYFSVGQTRIPPDTHVVLEHRDCAGDCPAWQVDVLADGTTWYQGYKQPGLNASHRYKLSKFALRRILRAFDRAHYFDLKANAYPLAAGKSVCTLTLISGPQKMSIRHACGEIAPEIATPVAAIHNATKVSALAAHARAPGLSVQAMDLPANDVVRPLVSPAHP